jgi:hypothetical protein
MLGPFATIQKSSRDCGISSPSWSRLHASCLHLQHIHRHSMIANTCIVHFVTSCSSGGSPLVEAHAERPQGDILSRSECAAATMCIATVATGATACRANSGSALLLDSSIIVYGMVWRLSSQHAALGGAPLQANAWLRLTSEDVHT